MNGVPLRPTGTNSFSFFVQRVWDKCFGEESQIRSTPSIIVENTTRGIFLHARRAGIGTGEAGVAIERFVLQEVWPNTLRCHSWDGTTEGSTDVYIAKPTKLRKTTSLRIDGITINYSYDESPSSVNRFQFRVATSSGAVPENQIVIPRYLVKSVTGLARGDEIWALKLDSSLFTETDPDDPAQTQSITYLDINVDGRAWGKQFPP